MNPDRIPSPANRSRLVTVAAETPKNGSGMVPVGTKVLVLPDEIAETTAGGIFLTSSSKEQNDFAVCTGALVAIGGASFTDWPSSEAKWPGQTPSVGDRVFIAKYAGVVIEGKDGKRYRLTQDTDVAGLEVPS